MQTAPLSTHTLSTYTPLILDLHSLLRKSHQVLPIFSTYDTLIMLAYLKQKYQWFRVTFPHFDCYVCYIRYDMHRTVHSSTTGTWPCVLNPEVELPY